MKENQSLPPNESASELPPKRILIVEDDILISRFNAEALERFGYEVVVTNDGAEAWAALNDSYCDLVITDNKMPNLTGVELLGKLRAARMELPVIMATGTLPKDEFARSPWLRPDATLLKPYTVGELIATVKKVLEKKFVATAVPNLFTDQNKMENEISRAGVPGATPRPHPANSSCRILVVDDDSDLRQLLVEVLAVSGYMVEAAKDGAAGWEALQAKSYDLVITDNKMPRLTGIEMIEKVRAARMPLPVIMATKFIPNHEFDSKPWLKPNAALERPFTSADLLEAVKNILNATESRERIVPPQA